MGNMYRILIESGEGLTVADLTAPVEMLAQFAPEAVARLLREATPEVQGDTPTTPKFTDAEPVRRKRRTKAEMEAARAAEAQESVQEDLATGNVTEAPTDQRTAGGGRGPEPEVYKPFS